MSKYFNKRTKNLIPYVPGEQPKEGETFIKINTNECPYPPSPRVIDAICQSVNESLRLYPAPDASLARRAFADKYNLSLECVFAGNGSDEVLAFSFLAFFAKDKKVLIPDITYSFYTVYCDLCELECKQIPLKDDFTIDVDAFVREKGNVVIANPNAPTSLALDISDIERILNAHPDDVVIIDEAYVDFGGESCIGLVNKYDNLLVVQTLSKSRALAGMRVGFACGSKELVDGLNRIKDSFNSYTLDRLAIVAAEAALKDDEYYKSVIDKIVSTRESVKKELMELGFKVLDSRTNFLFISHKTKNAEDIMSYLRSKGVLVRHFKTNRIDNYLRVTIGTDEEMDKFLSLIKDME